VHFYGRSGGVLPSVEEIVDKIDDLLELTTGPGGE